MEYAIGKLTNWTKGFKCAGVEGKDVVLLLKEALARRGDVNIEVNHSQVCMLKCQVQGVFLDFFF